jgi:hypothetical protein
MELCGDYKPKASPNSPSAITQFPSNYIFRLIKCGCLLIEILAVCSIAVSIELDVCPIETWAVCNHDQQCWKQSWSHTAGMKLNQICSRFRLCQNLLIKHLRSGWFWIAIIDLVTSHFLIYCLFDVVTFICNATKLRDQMTKGFIYITSQAMVMLIK